jgi:hypothetical protein
MGIIQFGKACVNKKCNSKWFLPGFGVRSGKEIQDMI